MSKHSEGETVTEESSADTDTGQAEETATEEVVAEADADETVAEATEDTPEA